MCTRSLTAGKVENALCIRHKKNLKLVVLLLHYEFRLLSIVVVEKGLQ